MPFDLDTAMRAPFPYSTYSTTTVGDQLIRQGLLLRQFRVKPGARVVEFGPGWGNLTLELAKMGFAMTAVDVNLEFGDLITQRAGKLGLEIQVVTSDMLDYQPDEPFEAAVFFESFHHCSDHLQMLRNLTRIVRDDGVLAFGAEPIGPLPYPWGLRPDGMAVWSTRKFGWLENGFTEQYFFEALERTGWKGDFFFSQDIPCSVVIARRILAG